MCVTPYKLETADRPRVYAVPGIVIWHKSVPQYRVRHFEKVYDFVRVLRKGSRLKVGPCDTRRTLDNPKKGVPGEREDDDLLNGSFLTDVLDMQPNPSDRS
jgi:hypothetical protein